MAKDKIKSFIQRNERSLLILSLVVGFIVDSFTLNRADQFLDNLILIGYLTLASGSLLLFYLSKEKKIGGLLLKIEIFLPYIIQYSFGGLFSGFIVLYIKSGSIVTSFPFIISLLALLISNEFIHKKYPWIGLHVTILFISFLSYATLITPVLFNRTGTLIFIIGTIIALSLIVLYVKIIRKLLPKTFKETKKYLKNSIIVTFITFNILYFANIIPPIPLSFKEGGIFHQVKKLPNGDFEVKGEKHEWYLPFKDYHDNVHINAGQKVYAFSSVFTPIKVEERIYHVWSYFDEEKIRWVTTSKIAINIFGGRDGGFRGYSEKSNIFPGKWRVDIENEKGQVIGRLRFEIISDGKKADLVTRVY